MSAHMVSVACFGPRGNRYHVGRSVPVRTRSTPLGRFVPRGKPCHVGRSVPLTQHAMKESDDE